jgi:hypothetical protein
VGQLAHAEIVDDQQRDRRQLSQVVLAGTGERRVGDFFQERVRFAIDDAIALLDGRVSDGLREMALAGAGRAEKQGIARWAMKRAVASS